MDYERNRQTGLLWQYRAMHSRGKKQLRRSISTICRTPQWNDRFEFWLAGDIAHVMNHVKLCDNFRGLGVINTWISPCFTGLAGRLYNSVSTTVLWWQNDCFLAVIMIRLWWVSAQIFGGISGETTEQMGDGRNDTELFCDRGELDGDRAAQVAAGGEKFPRILFASCRSIRSSTSALFVGQLFLGQFGKIFVFYAKGRTALWKERHSFEIRNQMAPECM